jgi:hypothetical protein
MNGKSRYAVVDKDDDGSDRDSDGGSEINWNDPDLCLRYSPETLRHKKEQRWAELEEMAKERGVEVTIKVQNSFDGDVKKFDEYILQQPEKKSAVPKPAGENVLAPVLVMSAPKKDTRHPIIAKLEDMESEHSFRFGTGKRIREVFLRDGDYVRQPQPVMARLNVENHGLYDALEWLVNVIKDISENEEKQTERSSNRTARENIQEYRGTSAVSAQVEVDDRFWEYKFQLRKYEARPSEMSMPQTGSISHGSRMQKFLPNTSN